MANNTMDNQNTKTVINKESPPTQLCDTKDDKSTLLADENDFTSQMNKNSVNSDSEISEKSASSDSRSTCVVHVRTEADIEPSNSRIRDNNSEDSSNVFINNKNDIVDQTHLHQTPINAANMSSMDGIENQNTSVPLGDNKIEKVLNNKNESSLNQHPSPVNNAITNASPSKNHPCNNDIAQSSTKNSSINGNNIEFEIVSENQNQKVSSPHKTNNIATTKIKITENLSNIESCKPFLNLESMSDYENVQEQEDNIKETDSLLIQQSNTQKPNAYAVDFTEEKDCLLPPKTNEKLVGNLPRNSSIKSASEFDQHTNETDNLLEKQTNGSISRYVSAKSASDIDQEKTTNQYKQNGKNVSAENFPRKGITKSSSIDIDKPVLHVQFDNKQSNSESTMPIKDPCSSPTASVSSSNSSSSSSSSEDDGSIGIAEARPPDGGWGWVVVIASFLVNLIADGITFSFGIIYVEFLSYFGEGKSKTAWIGSLFMAMPLLSGPVASFLTDRYGCRKVSIFGSILASSGFVISTFANSMELLFFTFGILAGFGLSLCYVAAVVIVAYYFDKRRSFATGLSVCGSGIGTFIFAPLIQVLLGEYGWRGTTLILAGLFLNLAVCGALMRDLPWTSHKRKVEKENRKSKRRRNNSSAETFSVSNSTNTASAVQSSGANQHVENANKDDVEDPTDDRLFSSLVNLPTYVHNGEKVPVEVLERLSTHKNVYNVLLQNYPGLLTSSRSFSDSGRLHENQPPEKAVPAISPLALDNSQSRQRPSNTEAAFLWWLKKTGNDQRTMPPRLQEKKLPAYLKDLRVHRLSLTYRGAMLNINRYRLRASSCPDIYRNSMTTIAKEKNQWYAGLWELWDLIIDMLDFSHFAEPRFLLFALSNFLLYTWYDVPYVYLTDNAIENGFSESDSSMLIAIVGIVNMIGEILLGWAGDRPWVNASLVYALCMGFCGIVTALVPLLSSYASLCAVSGAFGFFIAANYSLTSIILVELITIERFTNAYGLLLLVQGVANLIGPPLGGWLYDITGKYDLSFYLAGFFIAMSGLLLVVTPVTKRYRYFQSLQRQVSGVSEGSIGTANECSPKEPSFHSILASCITGKTEKETAKINHV